MTLMLPIVVVLGALGWTAETLVAWDAQRVTLGNANVMTSFIVPQDCRWITIHFESNAGHLTTAESGDCSDTGTKDGTDFWPINKDTPYIWRIPGSGQRTSRISAPTYTLCLSADTNATVVAVMCSPDGN